MTLPYHVLVVDDVADNRNLLVRQLEDHYRVSVAANGEEAIERIAKDRPDLMLLDLMMPVLDGFGVLAHLQREPAPFLPVIVVSAIAEREARLRALRAGAHEYLTKPVDDEELFARITTLLALKEAREEAERQATKVQLHNEELERTQAELRDAKRQAEDAANCKSKFLATMSHEIRTPLTAISSLADLLETTALSPEQEHYLKIFRRASDNFIALVNDVLDFSKVEAGCIQIEQRSFDLLEVIEHASEVGALRARAAGLMLGASVTPDVPRRVLGDANRLGQVLGNLLGNALKFTERGEIALIVSRDASGGPASLHFSVSDTGIGIPITELESIFEAFSQAEASTSRRYGGTGLGLPIARQLVTAMGGRMWVESEVGLGSTFHFTVVLPPDETSEILPEKVPSNQPPEPSSRILLAEDCEDNRLVFEAFFSGSPYQVEFVENGKLAVERYLASPYDLILMDLQMAVMDGYAATREIRRMEGLYHRPATPIIALSSSATLDEGDWGFSGHLLKPIRKAVLLKAVKSFLQKQP